VDVQLGRDPRLHQAPRERDVLVAEEVDGADVDERRWQARQVLGPGGGRVLVGLAVADVPGPGLDVALTVPDPDVDDLVLDAVVFVSSIMG